jgi:predicted HAD superfamily hydrolase
MKRKQTKYVLLDIFDTIVSRRVQPEYVKKIWSNNIVKMFKLDITAVELYELRNKIEIKLGSEALNSGHDCEIRYKDIIKEIYDNVTCNDSFDEFLETCTKEEIDIESNVLYVNDDVLDLIKEYKNNKKKLYCVSDMYLSKNMIIEILKKLDIDNYFEDVFVSSEYLCNKRSGLLYDIVLKEIKARPEECLMIGDS